MLYMVECTVICVVMCKRMLHIWFYVYSVSYVHESRGGSTGFIHPPLRMNIVIHVVICIRTLHVWLYIYIHIYIHIYIYIYIYIHIHIYIYIVSHIHRSNGDFVFLHWFTRIWTLPLPAEEREIFIDNLLVRIHLIIEMIR